MDDSQAPAALLQTPDPSDITQIAGPQDIIAAQQAAANAPATTTYGQDRYEAYKQQIAQNAPGTPPAELERMALQYAMNDDKAKQTQEAAANASLYGGQQAEAARQAQLEAMKAKMGFGKMSGTQTGSPALSAANFDPSQSQANPVDPMAMQKDLLDQNQKLIDTQKGISDKMADIGANQAKKEAGFYRELNNQAIQDENIQNIRRAQMQTEAQGYQEDMDRSAAQYRDFLSSPEAKVKTNNLWENMGIGQKVLAGISLALGAVGAGNTGKNSAVEIIQNAINQDIDAQKANIKLQAEGKLQNYNMSNNLYSQMLKKYQSTEMADTAVRLLRTQQIKMQMGAIAADSQGQETQQKAKMYDSVLDQSMLTLKHQFALESQNRAIRTQLGETPESTAVSMMGKDFQERYVSGYGPATNKEAAVKFQEARDRLGAPIENIDSILKGLQDFNRVTDPQKREELKTELGALSLSLIDALSKSKRFNQDELDNIKDLTGNPASFTKFSGLQKAKLLKTREILARELDGAASAAGLPRKNKTMLSFKPN